MTVSPLSASPARLVGRIAVAALLVASLACLAGCAGNHPITKSGEACASCHSDGRKAVADPDLSAATETGLTFAVESSAEEIYLCTASIAENGRVVPARMSMLGPDDLASVSVKSPGLYALCTGDIANPSKVVLVNATESGPEDAVVKL